MPRATVTLDAKQFDLKTCPGGWIKVRPLSYGQKKDRADAAGQSWMDIPEGRQKAQKLHLDSLTRKATMYDYERCIVDHNLEDDRGNKLDFGNPGTMDILDPRVGGEIEDILAALNGDNEDMSRFFSQSVESSSANGQDTQVLEP